MGTLIKPRTLREAINEHYTALDESVVLLMGEEYDEAIVGITEGDVVPPRVVYSRRKVVEILARQTSLDEAQTYFDFSIRGAYVANGPLFVTMPDEIEGR